MIVLCIPRPEWVGGCDCIPAKACVHYARCAGVETPIVHLSAALFDRVTERLNPCCHFLFVLSPDLWVGRTSEALGEEALLKERIPIVRYGVEILIQRGELRDTLLGYGYKSPQRTRLCGGRIDAKALTLRVDASPYDTAVVYSNGLNGGILVGWENIGGILIGEERIRRTACPVGRHNPEVPECVGDARDWIRRAGSQPERVRVDDTGAGVRTACEAVDLAHTPHTTLHRVNLHPANLGELRVAKLCAGF